MTRVTVKCNSQNNRDGWFHLCSLRKGHKGRHYCGHCWIEYKYRIFWRNVKRKRAK